MYVIDLVCKQCEKGFSTHAAWIRKGGGKYCSRPCANIAKSNKPIKWLKGLDRSFMTGKKNHNWKESGYTYESLHMWLNRWYKKEKCEICGTKKRLEWSNKSGKYLRSRDDFCVLCLKCHRGLDAKNPKGKNGFLRVEGMKKILLSVH